MAGRAGGRRLMEGGEMCCRLVCVTGGACLEHLSYATLLLPVPPHFAVN